MSKTETVKPSLVSAPLHTEQGSLSGLKKAEKERAMAEEGVFPPPASAQAPRNEAEPHKLSFLNTRIYCANCGKVTELRTQGGEALAPCKFCKKSVYAQTRRMLGFGRGSHDARR